MDFIRSIIWTRLQLLVKFYYCFSLFVWMNDCATRRFTSAAKRKWYANHFKFVTTVSSYVNHWIYLFVQRLVLKVEANKRCQKLINRSSFSQTGTHGQCCRHQRGAHPPHRRGHWRRGCPRLFHRSERWGSSSRPHQIGRNVQLVAHRKRWRQWNQLLKAIRFEQANQCIRRSRIVCLMT